MAQIQFCCIVINKVQNWYYVMEKVQSGKRECDYNILNSMNNSTEDEVLKEYIAELFGQYDTERKGSLNFEQLNRFFSDLLKSVGLNISYNYQQLYEVIFMANPSFSGKATPQDVYKIFKVMLSYGQTQMRPEQQHQPVTQPQYYQQPYPQMQGQYMNPMYPQYMAMQGQGGQGVQGAQMNGQVWGYNNFMGMNPYGYRQ